MAALFILRLLLIFVAVSIHVLMVVKIFTMVWVIRQTDDINVPEEDTSIFRRPLKMEDGYPPKNWYPHTRLFDMIIKRTSKQQHEEFITDIVGAEAKQYGMVVANLTDCTADVCSTWFYNFPIRAVHNWGSGSGIRIWNRVPYDPWSYGRPWFQRVT